MEKTGKKKFKMTLSLWIFVAMVAGIIAGICLTSQAAFVSTYIKPFGTIFVNLLKFIVVPVVLLSIICGMIQMKDIKKVGSIGWKTIVYFLATTAIAIVIGLIFANVFKGVFPKLATTDLVYEAKTANFMDTIVAIFPSNLWNSLVSANMLQVIVIALLLGSGVLLAGEKGLTAKNVFESLNEVINKVLMFIIKLTPIGVFCLMTDTVASNGPKILTSLAIVLGVAYLAYIVHLLLTYSLSVKFLGGLNPWKFLKGMIPAMIFAFTSTSSVATLPLTKECTDNLGADPEYSSFILPLGATINMDGTAIYMGVASVFIACCYGIELTIGQMLMIIITATLASIGTAGVSGAGVIMLAMVLQSVKLPIEGIALIIGIDKLFDMGRTTLNIVGDATCAIFVTRAEEKKAARLAKKNA